MTRKIRYRWTWGPYLARECPACRCTPLDPCTIYLDVDEPENVGACVPAGAYGFRRCSSCLFGLAHVRPWIGEPLGSDRIRERARRELGL
jgi:hypothetical protein